jgi:hypothetical protein
MRDKTWGERLENAVGLLPLIAGDSDGGVGRHVLLGEPHHRAGHRPHDPIRARWWPSC